MELIEGFKQTEVGEIPVDWDVKFLDELTDVIDPHPSHRAPKEVSNGIPFLGIGDFNENGEIIKDSFRVVPSTIYAEHQKRYNLNDELLGLGRVASIGKVIKFRKDLGMFTISPTMGVLKPINTTRNYLFQILKSQYVIHYFKKIMSGSTRSSVGMIVLRKIPIPIPKFLPEQTAIATALLDIDELILLTEKLIDKKKAIKQGVMQELLKPKEGWEIMELGNIAKFQKGKGLPKSHINESGKFKCIHYGELFTKYKEIITKILSYTDKIDNCFYSQINDVLMPTSDVTPNGLATASCVKEDGVLLGGDILVIRIRPNILDGIYLSYYISQNRDKIMKLVSGSTVYHLYGSDMKDFEVSFPHIKTQLEIVRVISDLDSEINILEMKLQKLKLQKQGMMQALLTGKIRLL